MPQVVRDAPWEYDEEFLERHKIDFVAHDDIPYTTEDCEDTYAMIKAKDMFVATERTEGEFPFSKIVGLREYSYWILEEKPTNRTLDFIPLFIKYAAPIVRWNYLVL